MHKYIGGLCTSALLKAIPCDVVFDLQITATDKLDGSTCSITIAKDVNSKWHTVELFGRNASLWNQSCGEFGAKAISYGNAGNLEKLPFVMFKFACAVGDSLGVNFLIVYGEAFRTKIQKKTSFHPFGYKIANASNAFMLTSAIHALFQMHCSIPVFTSHQEVLAYLNTATDHCVFPPPILFHGKLGDCIHHFFGAYMKKDDMTFEGVFRITEGENSDGFKFKTPFFEEQKGIPCINSLLFDTTIVEETYQKLITLFNNRPSFEERNNIMKSLEATKEKEKKSVVESELEIGIANACNNIFSKEASFADIPKRDRKSLIEKFLLLVIAEFVSHYETADVPLLWDIEVVKKNASSILTPKVMKV